MPVDLNTQQITDVEAVGVRDTNTGEVFVQKKPQEYRINRSVFDILWDEIMKEHGDYDAAMNNLIEAMCRGNASIIGTGKTFENFGNICHQMFYDDITKDDLAEDSESVDENEFLSLISNTTQEEKL